MLFRPEEIIAEDKCTITWLRSTRTISPRMPGLEPQARHSWSALSSGTAEPDFRIIAVPDLSPITIGRSDIPRQNSSTARLMPGQYGLA